MKRKFSVMYFMCCILVFSGCYTFRDPVYVKRQGNDKPFKGVASAKKVLIMQPFITAVTDTETPVSFLSSGALSLANDLEDYARSACQEAGSVIISPPNEDTAVKAFKTLASKSPVLMSYTKNKSELITSLQTIAQATGAEIIAAYSIMVKVGGSDIGRDSSTGMTYRSPDSVSIKAVLVSTETGQVLWGNEIFVRTRARDRECVEAAKKLFAEIQ